MHFFVATAGMSNIAKENPFLVQFHRLLSNVVLGGKSLRLKGGAVLLQLR